MILFVSSNYTNMKRLSNISPFILLLVPVFVMIILTFTTINSNNNNANNEVAVKTTSTPSWIKVSNTFVK
jgi:hypothetical protein